MLADKKAEFVVSFREFVRSYLPTPEGQDHVDRYAKERAEGRKNFEAVTAAAERREEVADQILLKLLPYRDFPAFKARGAWVHIAHAPGDHAALLKKNRPDDWPQAALALLGFIRRCNEHAEELEVACVEFSHSPYSAVGVQTGKLTPILNALRPDDFLIINAKPRQVINYFAGRSYGTSIADYPALNRAGRELVADASEEMAEELRRAGAPEMRDTDCLDTFSHWLVAVKRYGFDGSAAPQSPFSAETFDLLAGLHEDPTAAFYKARKEEFKEHLEEPFQRLLRWVADGLPAPISEAMETQKNIFAKITKNDYGRGGAWDYYWGALYPKGGKRIEDAQLSLWINREVLEFGFYIGEYGSAQRERFIRNCEESREALLSMLRGSLEDGSILYGGSEGPTGEHGLAFEDWLGKAHGDDIRARVVLPKEEVLKSPERRLDEQITRAFERLFPLILLAIHDDPLPIIEGYLGKKAQPTVDRGPLNVILYGPPGTGKTYSVQRKAVQILRPDKMHASDDEVREIYRRCSDEGRIEFVTFHPSYSYEEFVEGFRYDETTRAPTRHDGIFLDLVNRSSGKGKREEPYVLVIDEVNRGNLSRIFGELITLIEEDKRKGAPNELSARLLYSGSTLTVPTNLYLIGTMNTADRSIALVDTALRRRFEFEEMMPDVDVVRRVLQEKAKARDGEVDEGLVNLICDVFEVLNRRISLLLDRDHQVGHSYLLEATSMGKLHKTLYHSVFPLVQEYFYNDPAQLERLLGSYEKPANKGFVRRMEEYRTTFPGEDVPDDELPWELHVYPEEELEGALRSTFLGA